MSAPEARNAPLARREADGAGPRLAERMAQGVSRFTGSTAAFVAAVAAIVTWAASGPVFGYSSEWQLVVNTGTTIVTFLMVFVIQRAQNKESLAVQLKLNVIVAALEGASNRLINVESLGEEELATLHRHYARLVELSRKDTDLLQSHSVDEATARHGRKASAGPRGGSR